MDTTAAPLPYSYIEYIMGYGRVGKNLFSTSNPYSGTRPDLCIVVLVWIECIKGAGIDFLIVTLLFASVYVHDIVGLQTDLMLWREWFHN
jgi:hypothetical protein